MVPFVWVGRVLALSSRRLVPGDVVVVQRGKATCDMVLLRGAGLVEESMLSGEVSPAARHRLMRGGGGCPRAEGAGRGGGGVTGVGRRHVGDAEAGGVHATYKESAAARRLLICCVLRQVQQKGQAVGVGLGRWGGHRQRMQQLTCLEHGERSLQPDTAWVSMVVGARLLPARHSAIPCICFTLAIQLVHVSHTIADGTSAVIPSPRL